MAEKVLHTYEDYLEMPDDGRRRQIVGGELHVSPAPSPRHQVLVVTLVAALRGFVEEHDLGVVLVAPCDLLLTEHDVVQPDVLFVPTDRLSCVTDRAVEGPPAWVAEVLSPSTRALDRGPKLDLYRREGVEEVWIVDPDAETVERVGLGPAELEERTRWSRPDRVARSRVVEGFSLPLGELFDSPI